MPMPTSSARIGRISVVSVSMQISFSFSRRAISSSKASSHRRDDKRSSPILLCGRLFGASASTPSSLSRDMKRIFVIELFDFLKSGFFEMEECVILGKIDIRYGSSPASCSCRAISFPLMSVSLFFPLNFSGWSRISSRVPNCVEKRSGRFGPKPSKPRDIVRSIAHHRQIIDHLFRIDAEELFDLVSIDEQIVFMGIDDEDYGRRRAGIDLYRWSRCKPRFPFFPPI